MWTPLLLCQGTLPKCSLWRAFKAQFVMRKTQCVMGLALCINILIIMVCVLGASAHAHQMSTGYLSLSLDEQGQIQGEWQVRLFDVNEVVPVDSDVNGQLTWREFTRQQAAVLDYLRTNLRISRDDNVVSQDAVAVGVSQACRLVFSPQQQIDTHFNESYLVSPFSGACQGSGPIRIEYRAFFAVDSDHKVIVNLVSPERDYTRVISQETPILLINLQRSQWFTTLKEYVYQGIIHIWKGTDHILFLLALLLSCVLFRQNGQWQAIQDPKQIFKDTAWIITAFTLAHSVTLTASALELIHFSSHWVELGIALSVLLAALNNVWPMILRLGWITFAFGLLHGMGFAGVLGELGLPEHQTLLAILAFNLGVEIGQLAILAAVLPVLMLCRQQHWYRRWGVQLGSLAICVVALQWSIERF